MLGDLIGFCDLIVSDVDVTGLLEVVLYLLTKILHEPEESMFIPKGAAVVVDICASEFEASSRKRQTNSGKPPSGFKFMCVYQFK
jgi:hypothetical protein